MEITPHLVNREDFTPDHHEHSKLRLALLKENFDYQRFFEKLKDDPYSICPELRKSGESYDDYFARIHSMEVEGNPFFGDHTQDFGIYDRFIFEAQLGGDVLTDEILHLLNPAKDLENVSCQKLVKMLPLMFLSAGVTEFGRASGLVRGPNGKLRYQRYTPCLNIDLKSSERLVKIDLRKRKTQLISEFESFVDRELLTQKAGARLKLAIALEWEPENHRMRKEAQDQLTVWRLRKQRKSFRWIAKELGITEDLAKKRFYRAYELTQWQSYNKDNFKEIAQSSLRKSDWLNYCQRCQDKECLKALEKGLEWDPCPAVLPYIMQDQVGLSEKIITIYDKDEGKLKGLDDAEHLLKVPPR